MPYLPYYFLVFSECRSYVYVEETELYYLQSRYYNSEIGRFINADALVSTGQGLLGNNMFVYCLNNPVNAYDPCDTCFHRLDFWNDCARCGGNTIGDRWTNVIRWCESAYDYITNDDPQTVQKNLQTNHFSFYKGAMVFSTELVVDKSGFSFGVIVLDDYYESAPQSSFNRTLDHEYGHFLHMQQVGPAAYTSTTAIPSLISATIADRNGKGIRRWVYDNYYNLPAERIADQLGGVNRGYAPEANTVGSLYWIYTIAISLIS